MVVSCMENILLDLEDGFLNHRRWAVGCAKYYTPSLHKRPPFSVLPSSNHPPSPG